MFTKESYTKDTLSLFLKVEGLLSYSKSCVMVFLVFIVINVFWSHQVVLYFQRDQACPSVCSTIGISRCRKYNKTVPVSLVQLGCTSVQTSSCRLCRHITWLFSHLQTNQVCWYPYPIIAPVSRVQAGWAGILSIITCQSLYRSQPTDAIYSAVSFVSKVAFISLRDSRCSER